MSTSRGVSTLDQEIIDIAQSTGILEYTDCFSAER